MRIVLMTLIAGALVPAIQVQTDRAAGHTHTPGMTHQSAEAPAVHEAGQAAFASIAEIVALLEADSTTDWSRVDLERLRQHLVDMDAVVLRTQVTHRPIEGGVEALVTGSDRAGEAVRRMTQSHAAALAAGSSPYRMTVTPAAGGVRLRITAAAGAAAGTAERIRALGFVGIMTSGSHHSAHHLALARGVAVAGHVH